MSFFQVCFSGTEASKEKALALDNNDSINLQLDLREQALQAKETSLQALQESLNVAKIALEAGQAQLQADLAEFQDRQAGKKEWEDELLRNAYKSAFREINLNKKQDALDLQTKKREESYQERLVALALREQELSQIMKDLQTTELSFRKGQQQRQQAQLKPPTVVALMADVSLPFDETDPEMPAATTSKDST